MSYIVCSLKRTLPSSQRLKPMRHFVQSGRGWQFLNIVSLTLRRSDFCLLEAKHKTRRNVDGIETIRCGFLRRMG
ncbi:hypothetical protein Y032_0005g2550 [Ancylostoma ceylanicum]|uniref:Uncharacterized protein n=1 Tax=Ancylostoma ceylanicum TaxID=53326 RepID=A0A016VRR7_9BILA|nr:hypothetical protein Y032_0005g2550 [Ancylostoma ceylanicum]